MINSFVAAAIGLAAVVTWGSRVTPYILVKLSGLPDLVQRFLKYLPISIIFALILSSLFKRPEGGALQVQGLEVLAAIPTFYVAFKYKNLLASVIFGVVLLAALRFFF